MGHSINHSLGKEGSIVYTTNINIQALWFRIHDCSEILASGSPCRHVREGVLVCRRRWYLLITGAVRVRVEGGGITGRGGGVLLRDISRRGKVWGQLERGP